MAQNATLLVLVLLAAAFTLAAAAMFFDRAPRQRQWHARILATVFAAIAVVTWAIAGTRLLGDVGAAVCLGVLLGLLPLSLAIARNPDHGGLGIGISILAVALAVGAPKLPLLLARIHPKTGTATLLDIDTTIVLLRERIDKAQDVGRKLNPQMSNLKRALRYYSGRNFEELESDADALSMLQQYAQFRYRIEACRDYLMLCLSYRDELNIVRRDQARAARHRRLETPPPTRAQLHAIEEETAALPWEESVPVFTREELQYLFAQELER